MLSPTKIDSDVADAAAQGHSEACPPVFLQLKLPKLKLEELISLGLPALRAEASWAQ